jgi:hypothetical protein
MFFFILNNEAQQGLAGVLFIYFPDRKFIFSVSGGQYLLKKLRF